MLCLDRFSDFFKNPSRAWRVAGFGNMVMFAFPRQNDFSNNPNWFAFVLSLNMLAFAALRVFQYEFVVHSFFLTSNTSKKFKCRSEIF
jgi:hypothetical protein